MRIIFETIDNVKEFVSFCSKYKEYSIIVKQENRTVDARSILGIYSMNLLKSVEVIICTNDKCFEKEFYNKIGELIYESNII